ncbi:MAG: DUF3379 family protein [Gammaproteobacteria bacterium]
MDDLKFRRRAFAEPDCQNKDFLHKTKESKENTELVNHLHELDQKIKQAVNINPPEGLAERLILNQTLNHYSQNKHRTRAALSIAASVLLVFGLVLTLLQTWSSNDLEQQVLTHVYDELDHLIENQNKDTRHINHMLSSYGAELKQDIGQVNYLGSCNIANKEGVHIVLSGVKGSVTIMMLPHIKIDTEQNISDERFQGTILPAGKGSMAILGEKGEPLDQIEQTILNNLSWII